MSLLIKAYSKTYLMLTPMEKFKLFTDAFATPKFQCRKYSVHCIIIPVVSPYKYVGCVIDEHLELNDMVEEKAMAGKKALGAWFNPC